MLKKIFKKPLYMHKKGSTAIEYALIAALIAAVAITAIGLLGGTLGNSLNTVGNDFPTN